MRSYRPEELFDAAGLLVPELARLAPRGLPADERQPARQRRAAATRPGPARLPRLRGPASPAPGSGDGGEHPRARRLAAGRDQRATRRRSGCSARTRRPRTGCGAVFEVTGRAFDGEIIDGDNQLAPDGRVMEVLSEHLCQGWLEGYLLTGRHGLFNCYEAFIHIIDSMFNQHAKWLKVCRSIAWRRPVASLNYLLSSLVWRQDHNGFSHQDPGFIDHVVNKKAEIIRVYLPPDANTLLSVGRPLPALQALRQRDRGRQAAAGAVAVHGRGRHPLHARRGHLGMGLHRRRRRHAARRGAGLLRRHPHAGDAGGGRRCCASTCRRCRCAW